MLYGVSEEIIPAVTRPLGSIFVRDTPLSEYPRMIAEVGKVAPEIAYGIAYEVNTRIFLRFPEYFTDAERLGREWETRKSAPVVSLEEAKKKVFELEPWLLEPDDDEEEAKEEQALAEASREKLPLLSALGKYPRLGEQTITRERITVRNQAEPARPNLTNWMRVYRDELGVGYHDPMIRGKFIFNSDNCKKLSSEERERLNLILRSIEENVPVDIDPEKIEIVFPEFHTATKDSSVRSVPAASPTRAIPSVPAPVASQPRPVAVAPVSVQPSSPVVPNRPTHSFVPTPAFATSTARETPTHPSVATAPVAPPAPPRRPVSFVPTPPADLPIDGTFSFSSPHALPVESEEKGGLSIRRPGVVPLPSGQVIFGAEDGTGSIAPSTGPSSDPGFAGKKVAFDRPASDMNPFHIHPVGTQGRNQAPGTGAGRTVDLRSEE